MIRTSQQLGIYRFRNTSESKTYSCPGHLYLDNDFENILLFSLFLNIFNPIILIDGIHMTNFMPGDSVFNVSKFSSSMCWEQYLSYRTSSKNPSDGGPTNMGSSHSSGNSSQGRTSQSHTNNVVPSSADCSPVLLAEGINSTYGHVIIPIYKVPLRSTILEYYVKALSSSPLKCLSI